MNPPRPLPPESDPLADPRFARVLEALRQPALPDPAPDFAARVLDAALAPKAPRRFAFPFRHLARIAALLALFAAAFAWHAARDPDGSGVSSAASPLDILLSAQRPDGAWGPSPAPHRYDPAVTALALLALAHHDANPLASPHARAFAGGVESLLRAQRPDGAFAAAPDASYLAFQALRAAHALPGAPPEWSEALLRAAPSLPAPAQVAALNRRLAHPALPGPDPWLQAGGPAALAALDLIRN